MTVFAFEEVTSDLPNPPIAAQRALGSSGVSMPLSVWRSLALETRQALTHAGAADAVDAGHVRSLLRGITLGRVQLRHPLSDPNPSRLPPELDSILGPWQPLVAYHWGAMCGLHRWVLAALASNPRLLWRAMSEIGQRDRWTGSERLPPIHGMLARCEIRMTAEAFRALADYRFHAGRAGVLARASGVRAARWLADLVDAHSETSVGPVELEWGPQRGVGVLWQAHVSTAEGAFSPTASLLAVTSAAVAMVDLVREIDGGAQILGASITDEPWMFGQDDGESTLAV